MLFQWDLVQSYSINTELQCIINNKCLIASFSDHLVTEISLMADTFFMITYKICVPVHPPFVTSNKEYLMICHRIIH